jgi:formiminotetrahydrofolate cyclodeaminase
VYNVRINVASLEDKSRGAGLIEEANQLLAQTRGHVDTATAAVEKAIG